MKRCRRLLRGSRAQRMSALVTGRKLPKFRSSRRLQSTVFRLPTFSLSSYSSACHAGAGRRRVFICGSVPSEICNLPSAITTQSYVWGSVGSTGATVKVSGTNAVMYNGTNYLGAGRVFYPGSNNIPIVASIGTNRTEQNRTVYMPPTKPQVFKWDNNGNLTNDGRRAYTWDEENRLTGVSGTSLTASYTYDGQSRRVQKVVNGVTNTFTYDGWNLVSEISNTGSQITTNLYVWGLDLSQSLQGAGGIGGLLCVIRNVGAWGQVFD